MVNKHTKKKYKYIKDKIYTAPGRAKYRIKEYFNVVKYDFSNFYNHKDNYYHVVRYGAFGGSCVYEYSETELDKMKLKEAA